jgi:UDP-N-acetylmuramoyl-L-alanyl-D-glutamate--2,6-diaminopimelate ligase
MLPKKSTFTLVSPEGEIEVVVNMPGHYNILNALAGISIIYAVGGDIKSAVKALADFGGVPGRMQKVSGNAKFDIFVDYAHTDDALRNGLSMLKNVVKGRILVVFGCGGKRDRTKRPLMVKAVQDFADIAWATSDNPRGEALDQIFDDMKKGITNPDKICFIEDRRRAINLAIEAATDGDCILIAGKGHETFQELGDTIIPFDDKRVAEELLTLKGLL